MERLAKTVQQEVELSYLAGFFDGEGHIRISKHSKRGSYMLQISVVQAEQNPLQFFKEVFGGTISSRLTDYRGGKRALFTWQASSKVAEEALRAMLPYLRTKDYEALIALEFRKTFRPRYGDRSKLSLELENTRRKQMLDLQSARKAKRSAGIVMASVTCAAGS